MRRSAQFQIELGEGSVLQQAAVDSAIEEMVFGGGALNLKLLGGSSELLPENVDGGKAGAAYEPIRYEQDRAIFWTNSTSSVGAFPLASPGELDGEGLTSPEICTFVPTKGESTLSIASSRYVRLDVLAANAEPPVPAGTIS